MVGEVVLRDTVVMSANQNAVWTSRAGVLVAIFVWESTIAALDFSRASFGLFKQLVGEILWDRVLEGEGAQGSWLAFRD